MAFRLCGLIVKKGEKLQTIAMIFAHLSVVLKFPLSLVKIPSKKYFVDDTEDNDVFKERRRKKWEKVET